MFSFMTTIYIACNIGSSYAHIYSTNIKHTQISLTCTLHIKHFTHTHTSHTHTHTHTSLPTWIFLRGDPSIDPAQTVYYSAYDPVARMGEFMSAMRMQMYTIFCYCIKPEISESICSNSKYHIMKVAKNAIQTWEKLILFI